MGTPVPVATTLPPEGFRSGFPPFTMGGPGSYYVFQVAIADGTVADAVLVGEQRDGAWQRIWRGTAESRDELVGVVGWRDTIACADIRAVLLQYVAKPHGVVARGEWSIALQRHILASEGHAQVTCPACAALFIARWTERYGAMPEGWERFLAE